MKKISKRSFYVGSVIKFGRYRQSFEPNGIKDIQWIVLARRGNKALLLSRYSLHRLPYHSMYMDITWEGCDVRKWLNGYFLNAAFTKEEQERILVTKVDNSQEQGNPAYNTNGGNDTEDKVFLLSHKEAFKDYCKNKKSRLCIATVCAKGWGVLTNDARECSWRLRSPGFNQSSTSCVNNGYDLITSVNDDQIGLRPALWLDLDSETFGQMTKQTGSTRKK